MRRLSLVREHLNMLAACIDTEQGRSGSDNMVGMVRLSEIAFTVALLSSNTRT
jgi:hypothetical protein